MDEAKDFNTRKYTEPTPEIQEFAKLAQENDVIESELYTKYNVMRGTA